MSSHLSLNESDIPHLVVRTFPASEVPNVFSVPSIDAPGWVTLDEARAMNGLNFKRPEDGALPPAADTKFPARRCSRRRTSVTQFGKPVLALRGKK